MPEKAAKQKTEAEVLEFLAKPVKELELSTRPLHCLINAFGGDYPVSKLIQLSERSLVIGTNKIPNFGDRSLAEIKEQLAPFGLQFGMEFKEGSKLPSMPAPSILTVDGGEALSFFIDKGMTREDLKEWLLGSLIDADEPIPFEIGNSKIALPVTKTIIPKLIAGFLHKRKPLEIDFGKASVVLKYNPETQKGTLKLVF